MPNALADIFCSVYINIPGAVHIYIENSSPYCGTTTHPPIPPENVTHC
jgi:hypothetical protein